MTRVVHKFPISLTRMFDVPCGPGQVVMVGRDAGQTPCIWIEREVEPVPRMGVGAPLSIVYPRRTFAVHGTGEPIEGDMKHVGSFFDGPYVWHVYEVTP